MLVVRLEDGREWHSNPARAGTRFVPASTSKIPHTLIALETGYAEGPDTFFEWDGVERAFDAWNGDQTLATAYSRSAVWAYQRIAAELGSNTMRKWLTLFDYGNHDVGAPDEVTTYWLQGPLEISAREQVAFLGRLARNELPVKPGTLAAGKAIMRADRGDDWTMYAKTGWGMRPGQADIGWYVGWVEREPVDPEPGPTWVFAFNLDMADEATRSLRVPAARAVLGALGAIDINTDDEEN